jgi:hypothetical protein
MSISATCLSLHEIYVHRCLLYVYLCLLHVYLCLLYVYIFVCCMSRSVCYFVYFCLLVAFSVWC